MLPFSRLLLLFVTTVSTLSVSRRDLVSNTATATLIQDITNINDGVLGLTSAVDAFPGANLLTLAANGILVLADVADIHVVNRKGYVDALGAPDLDATQSKEIVDHTVATVGDSIPAGVVALKGKKQAFVDAGLVATVVASLELLKSDHESFSAALISKLNGSAETEAEGLAVVAKIDQALQDGINDFSS